MKSLVERRNLRSQTSVTGPRQMTHPFFQDRIAAPVRGIVLLRADSFRQAVFKANLNDSPLVQA
jgi:hypothetical protein